MKPKDSPSLKPFDAAASFPDYRAPILPAESFPSAPAPAAFPKFPTVQEMLEHEHGLKTHPLLRLAETPPRPTSLFQGLMGGRLEVLLQDAADHPERYDEVELLMLQELATGTRKLEGMTAAEREVLDRATLDYAAVRPPKDFKNAPIPKPPAPKKPKLLEADQEFADGREPLVETAGSVMSPYWWL